LTYDATWESVSSHPLPQWYEDAKLGVFLHWGLYSVPAWAPRAADITTLLRDHPPSWVLRHFPYAEWYPNTFRLAGSPTEQHHVATYGAGFPYDGFRSAFEEASTHADLGSLAALCRQSGAKYVVLTAKHSEGYCLWPTSEPHPVKGPYHAPRDLVGDLSRAVAAEGMRMGVYYSGGYDWSYDGAVLGSLGDVVLGGPRAADYARYAESHVLELVERYRPSLLWNDIGWPRQSNLPSVLAAYYNAVSDGVVNDRWYQMRRSGTRDFVVRAASGLVERLWPLLPASSKRVATLRGKHADFVTLEYSVPSGPQAFKWEATRGVGHSFGLNRNETADEVLRTEDLVHLLVDVVAKNGNLLIGIGPAPDGGIPEVQAEPLRGLGRWLRINGDAVYGTRPWASASAVTAGTPVRFTADEDTLYVTLLGRPASKELAVPGVRVDASGGTEEEGSSSALDIRVLGLPDARCHVRADGGVTVDFGSAAPAGPAHVVRISPRSACGPAVQPKIPRTRSRAD
jgi:alpha-L-fucosidase